MDGQAIAQSGISAGIVAILYALYKIFKHSDCTSSCCGRKTSFELNLNSPLDGTHV